MAGNQAREKRDQDVMREFLIAMRSGENISAACRQAGIERDGRLKWLRKKYSDFDAQVNELRWGPGRTATQGGKDKANSFLATPEREWGSKFDDARIESFLLTYRETRDTDTAARASGFLPSTVEAMLDPTSKKFHAEFARAMREEEVRRLWRVRDDVMRKAEDGDAISGRWVLERRMPEYGQRAKSATESNDAKFNVDSFRAAMEELKKDLLEFRKSAGRISRPNPDAGPGNPAADDGGVGEVSGTAADETGIN